LAEEETNVQSKWAVLSMHLAKTASNPGFFHFSI
jgi:hypothetical protein